MTATVHWEGIITARSSIAHGGETRGTTTLLRRELIPAGTDVEVVPLISGNAFRGRLRRCAEELFRDVLDLEGALPIPAAHALRGGGSLAKASGDPLSGARRAQVRDLILPLGVFGCAVSGTLIDGCLQVGKVVPCCAETAHVTGLPSTTSVFDLVQLEEYSKVDDGTHDATAMRYAVETFCAGTVFSTWLRLERATALQLAFFTDVLHRFDSFGQLGGRLAIGHGLVRPQWTRSLIAGTDPDLPDWSAWAQEHRDEILTELQGLT